jgi:hypothetical protein
MDFIKELIESRMYRRLEQVKGTDVATIGSLVFDHMLMLRVLYYIDKKKAQRYAKDTMKQQNFSGFRQSMTDLYNFLTLVISQRQYADKLFNDWDIVIPELRIKRVLRAVADGELDERDYDSLLLLLSRRIKNLTGDQMWLRRLVQDWQKRISRMDQTQAMTRILQTVRRPINTDLYMALQSSSKVTPTNT